MATEAIERRPHSSSGSKSGTLNGIPATPFSNTPFLPVDGCLHIRPTNGNCNNGNSNSAAHSRQSSQSSDPQQLFSSSINNINNINGTISSSEALDPVALAAKRARARSQWCMWLTNGTLAVLIRYLVQIDTLSFLVVVPLLCYVVFRCWDWLRIAFWTAPRDFWSLYHFIACRLTLISYARKKMGTLELWRRTLASHPKKAAFIFDRKTWTFEDVDSYSDAVGVHFSTNSTSPSGEKLEMLEEGSVVHIFLENRAEYPCLWLGLAKVGLLGSLINSNLKRDTLMHCIRCADSKVLIYDAALASAIKEILPELPSTMKLYYLASTTQAQPRPAAEKSGKEGETPAQNLPGIPLDPIIAKLRASGAKPPMRHTQNVRDPLLYIYTSGTTGLPKAAIISHTRFYYFPTMIRRMMRIRKSDVIYTPLPLYHSAGGMLGIGQALIYANTVVLRRKFSASQFWEDCKQYNCTAAQYVGEIARYLLAQAPKPVDREHKVRLAFGNGLRAQIWREFTDRFGVEQIGEFYGATEGNANVVNNDNHPGAVGWCSRILPFVYPVKLIKVDMQTGEVVRDANGMCITCQPGEPGELVGKIVKGNPLREFDGYVNKSANSKKVIPNVFSRGDTAFLTGDLLVMDEYGYLYFVDRTGDTFRWKGENVSTAEVEYVIARVLHMNDVVVYGVDVPGSEGKAGMAAIVAQLTDEEEARDLELLSNELASRLPVYARPMFLRVGHYIEDTGTFKLKKNELRTEGFNPSAVEISSRSRTRTRGTSESNDTAPTSSTNPNLNSSGASQCSMPPRADRLYYLDLSSNRYLPITQSVYGDILAGRIRF